MRWEDYKEAFLSDGASRFIRINQTTLDDWYRFIDFLRKTQALLHYTIDGKTLPIPGDLRTLKLSREHSHLLTFQLGGLKLYCPFLTAKEISFEVNPGDIDNEMKARVLFRFMSTLGRELDKPVSLLRPEVPEQAIFQYERGEGLRFIRPGS
jgi:hypothetical protein